MYRFRNGQGNQLNIDFAYGGSLLSKHSASVSLQFDAKSLPELQSQGLVLHAADLHKSLAV